MDRLLVTFSCFYNHDNNNYNVIIIIISDIKNKIVNYFVQLIA